MRKFLKIICTFLLIAGAFHLGMVASEHRSLTDKLIRLHVVADSNSAEDQAVKLQVRDAITEKLENVMAAMPDLESAKAYLLENLAMLEQTANRVLADAGNRCRATVTLDKEAFPTRAYDTFTLPAGVYESLRVTIGSGEGRNWWCVVFPGLCVSASAQEFEDTAAGAGFSEPVTGAVTGKNEYRVRFFLLDCIGWVENWLYERGF